MSRDECEAGVLEAGIQESVEFFSDAQNLDSR
jgi:hypothetical protein